MYHRFFIHSSLNGHVGASMSFLAIVNSGAMNTGVHMSFRIVVFSGYMPSSEIARSYDRFIPNFLKEPPYRSP